MIINTKNRKPDVIVHTNNEYYFKISFLDNEHILFIEKGDIYKSDLSGNKVNLTDTPFRESGFSIPANGDKIIYTSYQDEINNDNRTEIYLLDFESGNRQRMTYSNYSSFFPVISPDGNLFCFNSENSTDSNDISLILREFYRTVDDTLRNFAWTPAFSPDSRLIALQLQHCRSKRSS